MKKKKIFAGLASRDFEDCSAGTIECSVSTPGVRINSETGDVISEEAVHDVLPREELQKRKHQKLLSSTTIDDL